MSYRPLPEFLTIRDSGIEGLGLFATEKIYEDICIGVTHIYDVRFEDNLIRTPLGGYINHSKIPNCIIRKEEGAFYSELFQQLKKDYSFRNYLYTLRDIEVGEELTVTYKTYKI